jgi:DNA polymerase-1
MKKLLVDGDIVAYRATASAEFETNLGDDYWLLATNLGEAKAIAQEFVDDLTKASECDYIVFAFSGDTNYRKDVDPEYKSHRKGTRKPMGYRPFVEWLMSAYEYKVFPNIEGDDVLGLFADDDFILVSEDKDLKTVPSLHWDLKQKQYVEYDLATANRYWITQTLTGDPTDGYKGCPRIGAKTAEKLLADFKMTDDMPQVWDMVVATFEKAGLSQDDALRNARMARILRPNEYDFRTNEVRLWNPTML